MTRLTLVARGNTGRTIAVLGVGNAIMDVFAMVDETVLQRTGLVKGSMTLIDEEGARRLAVVLGSPIGVSGGSAANTMAGLAALGSPTAFLGKVADDVLGHVFTEDLRAVGVRFDPRLPGGVGPSTGRCVVLVTPDGERTMATYLGAATGLGMQDVDLELVKQAQLVYLEGYLWDAPEAKAAMALVAETAQEAGTGVSLTLSDGFCVERHRDSLLNLIVEHVDLLFANETEIRLLFDLGQLGSALDELRGLGVTAAVTLGERGSVVVSPEGSISVPAVPAPVVDTTGAGDLYAAGFLYGVSEGAPLTDAARIGSLAAAEVISHLGARPSALTYATAWRGSSDDRQGSPSA